MGNLETKTRSFPWGQRVIHKLLAIILFLISTFTATLLGCSTAFSPPTDSFGSNTTEPTTVSVILGASEILVEQDRLPFGVITSEGTSINGAEIQASFYHLDGSGIRIFKGNSGVKCEKTVLSIPHHHTNGKIHLHHGTTGIYVISDPPIGTPGIWMMDLKVAESANTPSLLGSLAFEAVTESATLVVGDQVPAINNPTIATTESIFGFNKTALPTFVRVIC